MKDLTEIKLGDIIYVWDRNGTTVGDPFDPTDTGDSSFGIAVCVEDLDNAKVHRFLYTPSEELACTIFLDPDPEKNAGVVWADSLAEFKRLFFVELMRESIEKMAKIAGWGKSHPAFKEFRGI